MTFNELEIWLKNIGSIRPHDWNWRFPINRHLRRDDVDATPDFEYVINYYIDDIMPSYLQPLKLSFNNIEHFTLFQLTWG